MLPLSLPDQLALDLKYLQGYDGKTWYAPAKPMDDTHIKGFLMVTIPWKGLGTQYVKRRAPGNTDTEIWVLHDSRFHHIATSLPPAPLKCVCGSGAPQGPEHSDWCDAKE